MTKRERLAATAALVLLIVTVIVLLTFAQENTAEAKSTNEDFISAFVVVEKGNISGTGIDYYVMYDSDTMVMYTFLDANDGNGGFSVLYNADGTVKTYSPYAE